MSLEQITNLFQWMTIINVLLLVFSSVLVMTLKEVVCKMHGKLFGLEKNQVAIVIYSYIGMYKILVIVFNIIPYIALRVIQ
jgi:uncharacterized protein DUF6868